MNLLNPEQPPDPTSAGDAASEPQVFATFVSEDGRLLKLARGVGGILVLQIQRNEPFVLDRFQAVAFGLAAATIEKIAS